MATAKKLPSGSWRIRVYSHTEELQLPDGTTKPKMIYRSFTCDDPTLKGKRKCEKMAADWAVSKETQIAATKMTVDEAITAYCQLKSHVLSPSTIKGYQTMQRNQFEEIKDIRISEITQVTVQQWVNRLARSKSPKYTKNVYGLFSAVLDQYAPENIMHIKMPQQIRPDLYVPSDQDIKKITDYFSSHDPDMLRAVYLAAFGTLRRSEVCALKVSDISGHIIHVRRAVVEDSENKLIEKTTKTYSSQRDIRMPDFFFQNLPQSGKIVNLTPIQVTHRFQRALERNGIPVFRFHDLRHYAASIMHAIGIPDQYIMQRGGWSSDGTLKRVYRNSMDDYSDMFTERLLGHFEDMKKQI